MGLISLVEYAKLNGITSATARQRAIRGSFKTARKIGRNWVIDKNEPLTDNRTKENNTMKLFYNDNSNKILVCEITTNHSMSIDDMLNHCDINMDEWADKQGWDGWDWDCLEIEV